MRCLSLDHLTDFLRGLVVGTERARIQEHLASGCPHCLQNQQWLLEVKRIAPLDDSFEFPAALTAHILSWMPAKPTVERTPLRTLIAQLLFDSFAPLPLAEARSAAVMDANAGTSVGRQLLYQVEQYDVDLRIEKNVEAYELLGQVLLENLNQSELTGLSVYLRDDETPVRSTMTDAEGMFRFTHLAPKSYQLNIVLGEDMIEIPNIVMSNQISGGSEERTDEMEWMDERLGEQFIRLFCEGR